MLLGSTEAHKTTFKRHGITMQEKSWLVYVHQKGNCPICLEPMIYESAHIDHDHSCPYSGTHPKNGSCKNCIRGAVHGICNSPVLMWLERYPHLQNDFIRAYLAGRPFNFEK